ncbi:maleylpyruvate isomerase N-terminal domain-containing protein [Cryobacterium sp. 1639]|uniref:maleylpyruvate isomerase N-terminal domain-containing protein n=1 Tax=Cryobacterium inferilacus TaxID=2866629 RepID=UPI001C7341A8|nr:maleylpyruvate isomerase N-terminal domain-containing protein [Cryobacterium sp. 1639]MBX0299994.1 maleylpyruvate isomerase N-terminal domain-containing protein [Cryobacterium sp. 1639]
MSETPRNWTDIVVAFDAATRWFVSVTAGIAERATDEPAGWNEVGLGEWSVRDLIGHTSRALSTVETYLDLAAEKDAAGSAAPVEVTSPAAYFARALAAGTPEIIAQRGRETAATLGAQPAAAVAAIAARVLARVATLSGTEPADTPAGRIRIAEYLPSRTVELTVHTSDLLQSQGVPAAEQTVPAAAAAATLHVLADLAVHQGVAAPLLRAATGRAPLAAGFTVL